MDDLTYLEWESAAGAMHVAPRTDCVVYVKVAVYFLIFLEVPDERESHAVHNRHLGGFDGEVD
jgi:hypothetical protein